MTAQVAPLVWRSSASLMSQSKPRRRHRVKPASSKSGIKRPGTKYLKDGSVKESFIQADILKWLKTTGLMFWRSNSGSLFLRGRHINLGPLGCADISLILPTRGTFVGLEVKSAKGSIRKEQVTYAAYLTSMGGKYFIVRSVEDAKNAVAQCLGEELWKHWSEPKTDG
jgi:hypothetical protein